MKDKDKTKGELTNELKTLRKRVTELEKSEIEYKQKEAVLKEKVERFESLFEASPLGISIHDSDGQFLQCNQSLLDMLGYSIDEFAKYDFTHPDDQEEGKRLFRELVSGKRDVYRREKRYIHKDGYIVWAKLTATIVRDEFDNPLYTVFIVDDITNRKQAEEKLKKVNRALRVLSECNQTLVRTTDESSLLHRICKDIVKIGGYRLAWVGYAKEDEDKSVQPVAQMGFSDGYLETVGITWADTERGRGPTGTAIRTGKTSIARNIQEAPDYAPWRDEATKRGFASSIALPLTDEKGQTFGALNIYATEPDAFDTEEVKLLTELTNDLAYGIVALRTRAEREKAEKKILESETRYRELFENMSSAVAVYEARDNGGDFVFSDFNKAGEEIEKTKREELIGKSVLEVFPGVKQFGLFEVFQRVWRTGKPEHHPVSFYKGNRISGWRDNYVYKLPSGEIVAVYDDITERKKAEKELKKHRERLEELVKERTEELNERNEELRQANIRLQEMDRLKSVFLASMSHELRTPLNSIIGFTGVLLMGMAGELNDEQRKQLTTVKNSANHLLSLINDVLDISKIEVGKIELALEEFELNDVVREVVETFSHKIDEKDLQLITEISEEITLYSDRRRVKQILMNLVSNAVKFTDYGSVKISARMLNDENLEIQVTDTGIGIEEEDMNKLFNPFMQVDMSLTKNYEGTGLGLYLCKKLVNLLGGDISAKSEYGKGSMFTFSIPKH